MDFDLAALIEENSGKYSMVYFGSKGSLDGAPHIKLDKDAGVGDTVDAGGVNEENLAISKLDGYRAVHLLCWDWEAVCSGGAARFNESDVNIKVVDDKGRAHKVSLDTGDLGNVCIVASIENSESGLALVNVSKAGLLKGRLSDTKQLVEVFSL